MNKKKNQNSDHNMSRRRRTRKSNAKVIKNHFHVIFSFNNNYITPKLLIN